MDKKKLTIITEIILEAAELISKFPKDISVLEEQKRVFNQEVDFLIKKIKNK